MGPIGKAARSGDLEETLRQTLYKVSDTLDSTNSARDVSSLAIKVVDIIECLKPHGAKGGNKQAKQAEVTQFEAISKRRSERRKAATG